MTGITGRLRRGLRRHCGLAVATLALVGCGGSGTQQTTTPVQGTQPVAKPEPPPPPPPTPPKARSFDALAAGDARAPWLAPGLEKRPADPYELRNLAGLGRKLAVGKTRDGYYIMTLNQGAVGPVALGDDARVIGVDARDGIIAVGKDGAVYRAANAAAAVKAGGFKRVGKAPVSGDVNATMYYDVAGRWVVAGDGATMWFSSNGGKRFRVFRTKKRETVQRALVRADGVMVLRIKNASEAEAKTYVSRRGGKAKLSTFQATGLFRIGNWIMDSADGGCTGVLARGGRRWVREDLPPWEIQQKRLSRWQRAFGHGWGPAAPLDPVATLANARKPQTPKFSKAKELKGTNKNCGATGSGSGSGRGTWLADIAGVAVNPTRYQLHLTHDGVPGSHPARAVRTDASGTAGKRVSFLALPRGCTPVFASSIRGLGVLACRDGATGTKLTVWEESQGSWVPAFQPDEGYEARPGVRTTSSQPLRAFSVASDGTVGMVPHCTDSCGIYVRAPVAVGTPNAWRRIAVPDAVAYRVVPGGRAVAMTSKASFALSKVPAIGRNPVPVQFVLSDGKTTTKLAEIQVGFRITAFAVGDKQIGLMLMKGRQFAPFMVSDKGGLVPAK